MNTTTKAMKEHKRRMFEEKPCGSITIQQSMALWNRYCLQAARVNT